MAAPTVYEDLAEDSGIRGHLFAGKKFWVAQRVPSRTRYVDLIKSNGGEMVLEKKADYLIADHNARGAPPGSISYTFIERSVELGALQDPDNHLAGQPAGSSRTPGSITIPAKSTRTPFTTQDDQILYKWVRDHTRKGGLDRGNEIYKSLQQKHPRHTWQSWRDRYIKKLQSMPPSAFNIPDNAPPSPPSDAPVISPPAPAPSQAKKPTARKPPPAATKARKLNTINSVEYTVEELTAEGLFDKKEWEYLHAFAEDIRSSTDEMYMQGWQEFASEKNKQTANQWRQYFEKVVMPQWIQDSDEKHAEIRSRVEQRHAKGKETAQQAEQTEDISPEQDQPEESPLKTPTLSSQVLLSSSTAVNETPDYLAEAYNKAFKRLHEDEESSGDEDEEPRPVKRQRSSSPELGTKQDPVEISSTGTDSQDLAQDEQPENALVEQPEAEDETSDLEGLEAIAPPVRESSLTPRALRYKANAFDTQAILSSPSQGAALGALPLPAGFTQLAEAQGGDKLSSEASQHTTESLEEFSQFMNDDDATLTNTAFAPLSQPEESPPPPSPSSSTGSGDPDPPLAPDEIDDFFAEQRALGFSDLDTAAALKHTRWRPDLAAEILEAWEQEAAFPRKRGIWTEEDDEDVESGNGAALARLERMHTMDGWGGITERLRFLARYRDARGV